MSENKTNDMPIAPALAAHDPAQLLEIARRTGLREFLHGVNAQHARQLLAEFVAGVEQHDLAVVAKQGLIGPLSEAQKAQARALYGNIQHFGMNAADDVIMHVAVRAYLNARIDFGTPGATAPIPEAGQAQGDNELKRCPFCRGQAVLEDHRTIWAVRCACGVSMLGDRAPEPDGTESDAYWKGIRDTAVTAWNRRASLPGMDWSAPARAQFEAWALGEGYSQQQLNARQEDGYEDPFLCGYWYCWLAALATRGEAAERVRLDGLRAVMCGVGIVGQIDGHDVIRRDSVIDLIDRSRAALAASAQAAQTDKMRKLCEIFGIKAPGNMTPMQAIACRLKDLQDALARATAPQGDDSRTAALEEAATLVTRYMAVPRDLMGAPTSAMKLRAAEGERIAEKIRALVVPASTKEGA